MNLPALYDQRLLRCKLLLRKWEITMNYTIAPLDQLEFIRMHSVQ